MSRNRKKFINPRYFLEETVEPPQQYAGDIETVADAVQSIEQILNQLYDSGVNNDGLKAALQQIIKDIDSGFVGEPT
jgi:hypothetical protein